MKLTEIRINLCPGPHTAPAERHAGSNAAGANCNGSNGTNPHPSHAGQRLRAFCSLTFDNTFVVRDVKLIEGNDGLFLAMPSRKLCDHCPTCGEKNHLRARFCNGCGRRLDETRSHRQSPHQPDHDSHAAPGSVASVPNAGHAGNGTPRVKLHADIAHPINAECRRRIGQQVIQAYWHEVECSRQPGYVSPSLEGEDYDSCEASRGSFRSLPMHRPASEPQGTTCRH